MSEILTVKDSAYETSGPTDVCKIPGPMGVPMPQPFPGKNIPMMWQDPCPKVLVENMPTVTQPSKGPMCKVHGGPLGPLVQGQPMGLGPGENVVPLTACTKMGGKPPCVNGSLYTMNGKNTPPGQASKGNKKVDVK